MSQPVSSVVLFWNKLLLLCLGLLITAACADRTEQATQHAAQADLHLQAGELWLARQSIGDAIAERDDLPELHLLHGRIEAASEAYGTAFAAYSNALALDSKNMEALQAVSQLGLRTGDLRESLDATERILVLQPSQESALLVRGIHAFARNRYGDAIEDADRVIALRPGSEEASILKSRALFMMGDAAEALEVIEAVQGGTADSEGVARTKLELSRETGSPQGMQAQFNRLRQLRPDDADLRIDEANLRFKLGEIQAGTKLLTDLLTREDLRQMSASQAIDLLRDYSAAIPEGAVPDLAASASQTTLVELARYFLENERAGASDLVIRQLPASEAQPLEARLALLRNQPSQALKTAKEVLSRDETQCDALLALSEASLANRDVPSATRSAQRAAAECPNRSEAWLATAAAYQARDEPIGVQRVYRDAIKANPQSFSTAKAYADWLAREGRQREALAIVRSFTRSSPALLRGWAYYRSLCTRLNGGCENDAQRGLAEARTRYGIDTRTGELPQTGLFGRLARR
ncbi:lipopolysaccharide assembly protein LapB [Erythrobacter sp. QSSC1-22B]|uniref:tetratricopeptide repeat protein n=1 Tax=Erythrobacter sp. QSSC1-22B TaxID=1860125 RepID=UPI001F2C6ADF|nr:tetratricopeptide repeat protein [Erythrobacter sp. QSSC1-22B]